MVRQVDIKALVSHIVRGDGADKCRICMGDTSEGQVYLGDTVMVDGDKPVTLAELLESITGVEVQLEDDMPAGLCSTCVTSALQAGHFRKLCLQVTDKWQEMLQLLENLSTDGFPEKNVKATFAIIHEEKISLVYDVSRTKTTKSAAQRLNCLNNNLETEEPEVSHRCHCIDCGKKFQYAHHLYQHLKESTDFKRACPYCAKIMHRDELLFHLREIHNKQPHECNKCPAIFRNKKQYLSHLSKAHIPGAVYCIECGCNFQSSHALRAHTPVHTPKTCPGCDRLFRNQTCYQYHVKHCCNLDENRYDTHRTKNKVTIEVKNTKSDRKVKVGMRGSTDRQCICDYCGKKFAGKKFVCAHIQIVHMKNTHRPCLYCGKLLPSAYMTEHVKKHQPSRTYTCDKCGIVLKTKLGYIQHNRLHTGEKPYACNYCGETFSASSRKSEHIRNKHRSSEIVLKHACNKCPAKFRLPYRLKKHMETVHGKGNLAPVLFKCDKCHEKFSSCRGLLHHSRKHQQPLLPIMKVKKDIKFKVYSEPMKDDDII